MVVLFIIAVTLTSAVTLFFMVKAINPNPETNPTLQDALTYSVIGAVLGRLPFSGVLVPAYWGWLFHNKFYLNVLALIVCTLVEWVVAVVTVMVLATMLSVPI